MLQDTGNAPGHWECSGIKGMFQDTRNAPGHWECSRTLGMLWDKRDVPGHWECSGTLGILLDKRDAPGHWEYSRTPGMLCSRTPHPDSSSHSCRSKELWNTRNAPLTPTENPWIFLLTTSPGVLQTPDKAGKEHRECCPGTPTPRASHSRALEWDVGNQDPTQHIPKYSLLATKKWEGAGIHPLPHSQVLFNTGALRTQSSEAFPDVGNPKFHNPTQAGEF